MSNGTSMGSGKMRIRGLVRKEFLQIVRDPSSIAIAFLMPIVLLLLFGYGVSLDSEHVPVAIVVEQPGADTADFTAAFHQSRYFNPVMYANTRDAEQAMMAGSVNAIVVLRQDFAKQLRDPDGRADPAHRQRCRRQQRASRLRLCAGRMGYVARTLRTAARTEIRGAGADGTTRLVQQ